MESSHTVEFWQKGSDNARTVHWVHQLLSYASNRRTDAISKTELQNKSVHTFIRIKIFTTLKKFRNPEKNTCFIPCGFWKQMTNLMFKRCVTLAKVSVRWPASVPLPTTGLKYQPGRRDQALLIPVQIRALLTAKGKLSYQAYSSACCKNRLY